MEVSVLDAISRMMRAAVQEQGGTLYVQAGERTEVILRGDAEERRILQGPPKVFEHLRSRLLEMAGLPIRDSAMTREGQIFYLVDGEMHPFLIRETRSLLAPDACFLTLRHVRERLPQRI